MSGAAIGPRPSLAEGVAGRLATVRRRIEAAGGDPSRVRVVAVTKGFGPTAAAAARACGILDVGESYAAELAAKAPAVAAGTRWHFLGQVQRNKVGLAAPWVHTWHGLDRVAEGEAIASAAPGARVMVQVAAVPSGVGRGGCAPEEVPPLVAALRALGLEVVGLMALGPAGPPERARATFRAVGRLAGELGLAERSMGMSGDLEVAVSEGATIVRVGQALFGPRPRPPAPIPRYPVSAVPGAHQGPG